jgi:hypothetical protein
VIAPIDPTGRADRHANRKLVRLLGLLGGVFVVGTGIGWIVGQIGHPAGETGVQNVATTVPASLPPAQTVVAPDALTPSTPQPAPAPPLPQPAAATPTDQHAATNFIAEATQQPAPPAPVAAPPAPPPPAPLAPSPSAAKSEPEVVIEPAPEQASPPEAAKPAEPVATAKPKPYAQHPTHLAKAAKHRPRPQVAAKHGGGAARVTVIGAKGAPAGAHWTIQLGAFRTHDHAALLVMTLQSHGTAAKVIKRDDGAKGVWYIVQTPSVQGLKAATAAAAAISRRERLAASVMRAVAS